MRHLIGIILALALGAALFFGAGWGFSHLTSLAGQGTGLTSPTGLVAWSALAATGLFLGIVIAVRAISPLAPGLTGLVLLAWSALLAVREHQALRWIPLQDHSYGAGFRALRGHRGRSRAIGHQHHVRAARGPRGRAGRPQ